MSDTDKVIGGLTVGDAKQAISIAAQLATLFVPGAQIAGVLSIGDVASLAQGIVDGVPDVKAAIADIQAATDDSAPLTPDQLAALKAGVDAADDAVQSA